MPVQKAGVAEGRQRKFLQKVAESKLRDAEVLLANQRWSGAYYLAGYAVEIGLKACIAARMVADIIPDKQLVLAAYQHNHKTLVGAAGLTAELEAEQAKNATFAEYWAFAGAWNTASRYELTEEFSAQFLVQAVNDPNAGILRWIRQHW